MTPRPDDISPRMPRVLAALVALTTPAANREAVLGDLEEHYRRALADPERAETARRVMWREAMTTAALMLLGRATHRGSSAPNTPHPPAPRGDRHMSILVADARHALRMLARRPAFTAIAIFTLALGIGATTAIFSVVKPLLFQAPPYPGADRIVMVWKWHGDAGKGNIGFGTFDDLTTASHTIETAAAMGDWRPTLTGNAEPERLAGQRVSPTFFRVLGVHPAIGRDFTALDDVRGSARVAILSHDLWTRRFNRDSSIVGRTITMDGDPVTVLGVMPASFENLVAPDAELWTTLRYTVGLEWACRSCQHLRMIARLKPNVGVPTAAAELTSILRGLARQYPGDYKDIALYVPTLQQDVAQAIKPVLITLLGAVVLVLLIACANVSNLLIARGIQRRSEFALRTALGAGRARLVRQVLTESLVLAGGGGVVGIVLAVLGTKLLVALAPASLPRTSSIGIDAGVLAFSCGITMITGILFGLAPAITALRPQLYDDIRRSSRTVGSGSRFTRSALVVSEVALALILMVGSGLLLRSSAMILGIAPGFDATNLLTMQVQAAGTRMRSDTAVRQFFDEAVARTREIPGVHSAALVSQLPLSSDFDGYGVHRQTAAAAGTSIDRSAFRFAVTPGYFETMKIPLVRGRLFGDADRPGALPVAVLSASFAKALFPDREPLGERIRIGDTASGPWYEIIGIVGDVRHVSIDAEQLNGVYTTMSQWKYSDDVMSLVVRASVPAGTLAPAVRKTIWSIDKDQAITRVQTMTDMLTLAQSERRFTLLLFELFGGVAILLAAAGIYGVLAGTVTERLREIGVRAALGATRSHLLMLVLRQGVAMSLLGVAAGVVASLALSGVLGSMLYRVSRADPVTYAAVSAAVLALATVTCLVPAWRAAKVDPMDTLRAE